MFGGAKSACPDPAVQGVLPALATKVAAGDAHHEEVGIQGALVACVHELGQRPVAWCAAWRFLDEASADGGDAAVGALQVVESCVVRRSSVRLFVFAIG